MVDDVTMGDFLGSTGRTVIPVGPIISNEVGKVTFGALTDGTTPGPNGMGELAIISLIAQGKGESPLDLQNVQVRDTFGNSQVASDENGSVIVKPAPTIIYVKADATGANNGISWADAYADLQAALAAANSGDEIWVAVGTYKPTTGTNRTATFQLKNSVALYGGFTGGETARDQRDWETNVTILSGDIGTLGDNSGNSYHVVTGSGGATAVLDGFTITGGNADGGGYHDKGGGIYNRQYSHPTLTNCTLSHNSARWGGGVYNYTSHPTLTNCTFSGNSATDYGGGMYNYWESKPMLTNCTFSGNSANYGGGMGNWFRSNPTLTNCTFSGNDANSFGGGMYNEYSSSPTVTNCTFSGNSAPVGGGMHNSSDSNPTVTNCTFSGNSAGEGGGMCNWGSNPTVTNCTFSGNSAPVGGGMNNAGYSNPTVTNCTFSGNSANYGGGMHNFSGSNPTVTNCTFNDNSANYGGGMDNIGSPTVTNCTFSGNSANYGGGMHNEGCPCSGEPSNPTVTNCTFSHNSANHHGGGMYNGSPSNPTLRNTILANSTSGGDCYGPLTSEGYNLDSDGTCGFAAESDFSNTDPLLGPLQDNGSPTLTHALLPGSLAIDAGSPDCPPPATDQRGEVRPADGNGDCTAICDIGAYEVRAADDTDSDGLGGDCDNCPSTVRHKSLGSLGRERTTSVCPLERLGHRAVEVVNELQNTLPQVIH